MCYSKSGILGGFKGNGGNHECMPCSTVTEIANDPNENIILFSSASQKKPRTLAKGIRFQTRKHGQLTRKKIDERMDEGLYEELQKMGKRMTERIYE